MNTTHDAPLFSKRALRTFLVVEALLMLALITAASYRLRQSPLAFLSVYLYVLAIPVAGTIKAISVIPDVDDGRLPPQVRQWLSSIALLYPVTAGMIPLFLILRYAGG
jgi:hypothetical protein